MNYSSVSLVTEGAESARPPESIYSGSNSTRERHRERERHRHVEQDAPCYSDTHTQANLKPNFRFQHFFSLTAELRTCILYVSSKQNNREVTLRHHLVLQVVI